MRARSSADAAIGSPDVTYWELTASADAYPAGAQPRTVEVWAKGYDDEDWLFTYGDHFGLYMREPNLLRAYYTPGSWADMWLPHSVADDAWHQYVLTYDGDNLLLYLDGAQVAAATVGPLSTPALGTELKVGDAAGDFDEVAVYDTALSSSRVSEHWAVGQSSSGQTCPAAPSTPYSDSVLADGPSAYYRMGELADDPGSRAAYDASGNCYHGSFASGTTAAASGALLSDGDGAITSPDNGQWDGLWSAAPFPNAAQPRTVEVWAKGYDDEDWLFTYGDHFGLYMREPNLLRAYYAPGTYANMWLPHSVADGAWHHYALAYDGDRLLLYLDGAQVAAASVGAIDTADLGAELKVGDAAGDFDEVAIYPTALAPTRIAEHWAVGQSTTGQTCPAAPTSPYAQSVLADAPVGYYRVNELTTDPGSRTAYDASGNCRHGSLATGTQALATGAVLSELDGAITSPDNAQWDGLWSGAELPTGSAPRTVEAWYRGYDDEDWIFTYGDTFGLQMGEPYLLRGYYAPGTYANLTLPHSVTDGAWHHYALAYDGDNLVLYLDGAQVAAAAVGPIDTADVGAELKVGDAAGDFDEIAVYATALAPVRISEHWALGQSSLGDPCPTPASTPYAASVLADDPDGYYRLGELESDPGSRVAFDSSGNCRHGSIASGATAADLSAVRSDADGALTSPDNLQWDALATGAELPTGNAPRTVEAWYRGYDDEDWIFTYGDTFGLYMREPNLLRAYYAPGTWADMWLPHSVTDGAWHHYALAYDGDNLILYLDGAQVSAAAVGPIDTADLEAELRVGDAAGDFDEVAVYPTALTPARVAEHWTVAGTTSGGGCAPESFSGHAQAVADDDPLLYWRLGDQTTDPDTPVAFDSSGNCRNGSYSAAAVALAESALADDPDGALTSPDNLYWDATGPGTALPAGDAARSIELWNRGYDDEDWLAQYGNFGLYQREPNLLRAYYGPGVWANMWLPASLADGGWHHLVLAYDGAGTLTLYLDGAEAATAAGIAIDTPALGAQLSVGDGAGDYDEVAVYDRALTAGAVADHYDAAQLSDSHTTIEGPAGEWREATDLDFTVTAQAAIAAAGTPTGTVELFDDNTSLGTATIDAAGQATFTIQLDPGANHRIYATYSGDPTFIASRSPALTEVVTEAKPTDTALIIDPASTSYGQAVTLTATITTPEPTPPAPTGDVIFTADGAEIGRAALDAAGVAQLTTATLDAGTHQLVATYDGDIVFESSTSSPAAHTVDPGGTTVTVTGPPLGESTFSEAVTFRAEVAPTPPAAGSPTGVVSFLVDGIEVDQKVLIGGAATSTALADIAAGSHQITATYTPATGNWSASDNSAVPLAYTVHAATTSLLLTVDQTLVGAGEPLTFTAYTASLPPATATPTGAIRFTADGTEIDTLALADGTAQLVTSDLATGTYHIAAEYLPDPGFSGATSNEFDVTVGKAATVELTSDTAATVYGQQVTFTATATGDDGGTPTGVVVLRDGTAPVATLPLNDGEAIFAVSTLEPAAHTLTAAFAGGGGYAPADSEPLTHTVSPADTTTSVAVAPSPSGTGETVQLTATVAPVAPGAGGPKGFVSFYVDGAPDPVAVGAVLNGQAKALHSFDTVGSHTVVAVYGGTSRYQGSTSTAATHEVQPGSQLALDVAPNPAAFGEAVTLTATATSPLGTPDGTMTFTADGVEVAATGTTDGVATVEIDDLSVDFHILEADFRSDAWGSSTSDPVTLEIEAAQARVAVSASPTSAVVGEPVTFAAEVVSTSPDLPTPRGYVTFSVDGQPLGVAQVRSGTATLTTDDLAVGTHSIEASYGGDVIYDSATASSPTTVEVNPAQATVELAASPTPAAPNTPVELTATVGVAAPGNAEVTGDVDFFLDTAPVGTAAIGPDGTATLEITAPAALSTYTLSASYPGAGDLLGATSADLTLPVNNAVTVAVNPPAANSALGAPAAFNITVAPADGAITTVPTGDVTLIDDTGAILGTATLDAAGAATATVATLEAGTHTLTATYGGDPTFAYGQSAPTDHTVDPGTTTLALSTPTPASGEGRPVVVTATVTGSAGAQIEPTGTVSFTVDGSPAGDIAVGWDGRAAITLNGLTVGPHSFDATYSGDPNYGPSTATQLSHDIVPALDPAFTVTPTRGTSPLQISVEATGDNPNATNWIWDFGDGTRLTGPTATHTLTRPGIYTIALNVYDDVQHVWSTQRVTVVEDTAPKAVAGGDRVVVEGQTLTVDGGGSRPAFGIQQYIWDFGDGTTTTGERATHTYTTPGTYTAELTVVALSGDTATQTFAVTVVAASSDELAVTTKTTGGTLLSGVDVIVEHPLHGRYSATSASDGVARLGGLPDGTYTLYAVAPGYLPLATQATIVDGSGTLTVSLQEGEVGTAELTVERLDTIEEILAAGIDPTDPANNLVFEFETNLGFGGTNTTSVNSSGQIVSGGSFSGSRGGISYQADPSVVPVEDGYALVWIIIPIKASFLKEFFDVQLTVTNGASTPFRFTDGQALLHVPDGMSLAPTSQPQALSQPMPDVASGAAESVSWIVRGDTEGTYTLDAEYTAVLDPVGTSVYLTASTTSPVQVYGGSAAHLTIEAEEQASSGHPYNVRLALENVSPSPIFNPVIEAGNPASEFLYQPRQERTWQRPQLDPGEVWEIDDVVVFPWVSGPLNVEQSFSAGVGDANSLPVTISGFEGPTEYELDDGDSISTSGANPLGKIALHLEPVPGATGYEVWESPDRDTPFDGPLDTITDLTVDDAGRIVWLSDQRLPGSEGIFALRPLGVGEEDAVHNAVEAEAGTETEPPWVSRRLQSLETRMESCHERSHLGTRPRVGTPKRKRTRRSGWYVNCVRSWAPSTGLCSGSRTSSATGSSRSASGYASGT